jgi:hypothetical protein
LAKTSSVPFRLSKRLLTRTIGITGHFGKSGKSSPKGKRFPGGKAEEENGL